MCLIFPKKIQHVNLKNYLFDSLLSQVYEYQNNGLFFFICGDFNSRCGDEHDYIAGGDEYDYIAGIDDVSVRSGLDFTRNSHCNTFIEFFTSVNCCMLNDRVGNDNGAYMCFL